MEKSSDFGAVWLGFQKAAQTSLENLTSGNKFQTHENTQCSKNWVAEITKALMKMNPTGRNGSESGTALHWQGASNLCHSFALNTALRRALSDVARGRKSKEVKIDTFKVVKSGKTALEILNDNSTDAPTWGAGEINICSFQHMMANIIGNVIPRNLTGLDGHGIRVPKNLLFYSNGKH